MTSTNINQGLLDGSKPSSKVLHPPGGVSNDIFGTGTAPVAPPQRARAPPSNNIFGGYDEPARNAPRHDRMKSNVFGEEAAKPAPTPETNDKPKSDEEGEEDDKEKQKDEESNNNDAKEPKAPQPQSTPMHKSKGDSVYNPITGELNHGQSESPTKVSGKARGEFNINDSVTCLSDNGSPSAAQLSPGTRRSPRPVDSLVLGPTSSAQERPVSVCSRRLNADVSNPITGEKKSYAIGGVGENVSRPSTRVVQPPGGASTRLW